MLQPKYAKQLDSNIRELIANGGSSEDVDKMASDYTSLFSDEALKKKDTSTSTIPKASTESVQKVGSSATQVSKGFPKVDTNSIAPNVEGMKYVQEKKDKRQEYLNNVDLNDDDKSEIEQKVNNKLEGKGFFNTATDYLSRTGSAIKGLVTAPTIGLGVDMASTAFNTKTDLAENDKKQAIAELKKEGFSLTPKAIEDRTKQIIRTTLEDSKISEKYNAYFEDKTDKEREDLAKTTMGAEFQADVKLNATNIKKNLEFEKINHIDEQLKDLKLEHDKGIDVSEQANELLKQRNESVANYNKHLNDFTKDTKNLMGLRKELDLVSRDYHSIETLPQNLGAGFERILGGTLSYGGQVMKGLEDYSHLAKHISPLYSTAVKETADLVHSVTGYRMSEIAKKTGASMQDDSQRNLNELQKPMTLDDINNAYDLGAFVGQETVTQAPILATAMSGHLGLAVLGASTAGNKIQDMETEERLDPSVKYSDAEKLLASTGFGLSEVLLGQLPSVKILKRSIASATATEFEKNLFQKGMKASTEMIKSSLEESVTEGLTEFSNNAVDKFYLGKKNTNLYDNVTYASFTGGLLGGVMHATPQLIGAAIKPFIEQSETKIIDSNLIKVFKLQTDLNKDGVSAENKAFLQSKIDGLIAENNKIIKSQIKVAENTSEIKFNAINEIMTSKGDLLSKAESIKADDNISSEGKKTMLEDLKTQYKELNTRHSGIVDGSITEVDLLPIKEQDAIKKQALKELTAEQNPDGTKDITIDNAQIVERANKIHSENIINEKKPITTSEGKPQTEIQKPSETEKVNEDLKLSLTDTKEVADEKIKKTKELENPLVVEQTTTDTKEQSNEVVPSVYSKEVSPIEDVVAPSVENDNGIKQVKSFKKGEGGTLGVFEDADGKLYKSIVPTSRRIENGEVKFDANHNNPTEEFDILTENQDLPNLPKIGKLIDTNEGKAFEIEKLNEVDKLTYDEISTIQGTIAKLNERGVFVNDKNTVMRRDNGEVVLVDLSTAQKSDSKYDAPELVSQNIIDLLNTSDKGRFNAENRAKNILEIQEGLDIAQGVKSEYTYLLTQRPPSIGTHPIDNIKGEIKEIKLGNRVAYEITYNKELSKEEVSKFELTPKLDEYDSGKVFVKDSGSNKIYLVVENVAEDNVEITMYIAGKEKTTNYTYRQASKLLNDYTPVNEATPPTNTPADGNVRPTTPNVGEVVPNITDKSIEAKPIEVISEDVKGKSVETAQVKKPKPTSKERVAERIKASDAKIDDIRDAIKSMDTIFGIKIKVDDIDGLNTNGVDLVNVIASIVKQAMAAGIEIDEAISKTIEHLKSKLGDIDVDIDEIRNKVLGRSKNKPIVKEDISDSRREKSSKETASDLGISESEYLDLKESVANTPKSGVFNEYLSAETISDVFGEAPTNDQNYERMILLNAIEHGNIILEKAKEIFGENFIPKTLDFLIATKLENFEKAIVYAALENLMDTMVKDNPTDKKAKDLQMLVYADSQSNRRNSSKAMNTGRLIRLHNAIKNGIDVDKITSRLYTKKQLEGKTILEDAVPNGENLNNADETSDKEFSKEEFEIKLEEEIVKAKKEWEETNLGFEIRETKIKIKKEEALAQIQKIKDNWKRASRDGTLAVSLPYAKQLIAVTPDIIKLANIYRQIGGMTAVDIFEAIKLDVADAFDLIKDKDIKAILKKEFGKKSRTSKQASAETKAINSNKKALEAQKSKESKISNIVKQALIDAGFSREITVTKGSVDADGNKVVTKEKRTVLDWNKLTGRINNIDSLRDNVEAKLKEQGYSDEKISEIKKELEEEYTRLSKLITDKAIAELVRRDIIKESATQKSDGEKLAELNNKGLFGDDIKKYENLMNRILGFSSIDENKYNEIKKKINALAALYQEKTDGKPLTALSISSQEAQLNKDISDLLSVAAFKKGDLRLKTAFVLMESSILGLKSLLSGIKTLSENIVSGKFADFSNKKFISTDITPELRKQTKLNAKMLKADIISKGGLDYGTISTFLISHSLIEDLISKKLSSRLAHQIMSIITVRRWLNAEDSVNKYKLTEPIFIKNTIKLLMAKGMSREDSLKYVSESLTGDNFEKALASAKEIIDRINSSEDGKQLKDNKEAIHRFAMDIVRQNLMSGNIMTMDEVAKSFKASYKGAGSDIGHEANNYISKQVARTQQEIGESLNEAIRDEDWGKASWRMLHLTLYKTIISPFAGGGANWVVIGAEKGIPIIGWVSTIDNFQNKKKLDLVSEEGKKNIVDSLYYNHKAKASLVRNIIGIGTLVASYVALYGLSGDKDDEETNAKRLKKWMGKKENKWAKPYFDKLAFTPIVVMMAYENNESGKILAKTLGINGDLYDNTAKLFKAFDSKKKGAVSGAAGKIIGQPFNSPLPYKYIYDATNIWRGVNGLPELKTDYEVNGFLNGVFQGGIVDALGYRPEPPKIEYKNHKNSTNKKAYDTGF